MWRGRGGASLSPLCIVIETPARFAAEPARRDQLLLDQRGAIARIGEESVEDRAGDGKVHVVADQVDQFERPHAEPARVAQDRIDSLRLCNALLT